jgi:hypothetical protein
LWLFNDKLAAKGARMQTGHSNFYSSLAQILPLLLLAFIWESGFLARLRRQRRLRRNAGVMGVLFWTKPRVRVYTLAVASIVLGSTAVTMFVLAGMIPDSGALRIVLSAGLVLVLLTLLTRITVDVLWATASIPTSDRPPEHSAGAAFKEPSDGAG